MQLPFRFQCLVITKRLGTESSDISRPISSSKSATSVLVGGHYVDSITLSKRTAKSTGRQMLEKETMQSSNHMIQVQVLCLFQGTWYWYIDASDHKQHIYLSIMYHNVRFSNTLRSVMSNQNTCHNSTTCSMRKITYHLYRVNKSITHNIYIYMSMALYK